MEYSLIGSMAVAVLFIVVGLIVLVRSYGSRKHPPGPPGWPVVGNMFDLGNLPHQTLYSLGFKYGPVVWLRLGFKNTLVVQSAKAATEFFKNHDSVFCDRQNHHVMTAHDYHKGSVIVGRYGPYWRMIRRICSIELMSNRRINESTLIREKCIHNTIKFIEDALRDSEAKREPGVVNLSHFLFLLTFNLFGNLTFSKDLLDPQCEKGHEFYGAMDHIMTYAGMPNVADFLPFLKHFDPQKLMKNMKRDLGKAMEIVRGFINEKMEEKKLGKTKEGDFLDVLLERESTEDKGSQKMTHDQIIILILEIFLAGSETTSTTMEWLMAELLRNPHAMRKVKEELDQVVGPGTAVKESDIDKLPYLHAAIKEALRLHPAGPLLIPRNTIEDTNFMGYFIPKGTQVFVNVWAIGRDKEIWEDPLLYKPERFIGSDIDYKGQHFELIPFGAGRRICVGLPLAHKIVHFAMASLLHHFDWELGGNCTPDTLDMTETPGLTARMHVPLKVMPKKRVVESVF